MFCCRRGIRGKLGNYELLNIIWRGGSRYLNRFGIPCPEVFSPDTLATFNIMGTPDAKSPPYSS